MDHIRLHQVLKMQAAHHGKLYREYMEMAVKSGDTVRGSTPRLIHKHLRDSYNEMSKLVLEFGENG